MSHGLDILKQPTLDEVTTCDLCGHRVLAFVIRAVNGQATVLIDPTAGQRRWVRTLMTAREYSVGPPWSWGFGRYHECPPPGDSPLDEREAELRRRGHDPDSGCDPIGGAR